MDVRCFSAPRHESTTMQHASGFRLLRGRRVAPLAAFAAAVLVLAASSAAQEEPAPPCAGWLEVASTSAVRAVLRTSGQGASRVEVHTQAGPEEGEALLVLAFEGPDRRMAEERYLCAEGTVLLAGTLDRREVPHLERFDPPLPLYRLPLGASDTSLDWEGTFTTETGERATELPARAEVRTGPARAAGPGETEGSGARAAGTDGEVAPSCVTVVIDLDLLGASGVLATVHRESCLAVSLSDTESLPLPPLPLSRTVEVRGLTLGEPETWTLEQLVGE